MFISTTLYQLLLAGSFVTWVAIYPRAHTHTHNYNTYIIIVIISLPVDHLQVSECAVLLGVWSSFLFRFPQCIIVDSHVEGASSIDSLIFLPILINLSAPARDRQCTFLHVIILFIVSFFWRFQRVCVCMYADVLWKKSKGADANLCMGYEIKTIIYNLWRLQVGVVFINVLKNKSLSKEIDTYF